VGKQGKPGGERRATVWDVARAAGVSAKTVSRVLNSEPGVTGATAARVVAAIAELGFRRNELARMLRTGGRAKTLGLVIGELDEPHSAGIAAAVSRAARDKGYMVLTGSTEGDPATERELVGWLLDRQADALLIAPAGDDHRYLGPELGRGLAVVFVERPAQLIEADCVVADNVDAARQATQHLLRHRHRRIAFIGGRPQIFTAAERLAGYRDALATGGIWVDPELIRMGVEDASGGRQAAQQLLALSTPPTAIVAAGSRLAMGVVQALERSGTAVVGVDDLDLAATMQTPLTTVSCDPAGIASSAVSLLLERPSGEPRGARRIVLPVTLTARGLGELRPGVGGRLAATRRWYRR
jgi:LacI family transcriptional regulator